MLTISNKKVAEKALRKIGSFSINDSAADPEELQETLFWLDQIVGFNTAVDDFYWLVNATIEITLTADQPSYNLENALLTNAPEEGVFFVVAAYVTDGNGRDTPIEILSREQYEAISKKTASGTPESIYINRLTPTETLYTYPVMGTGASNTIKLVFRTYSDDLTKKRVYATSGMPPEWQLWMITATAAEIGNGPVRKLPRAEVKELKADAKEMFMRLQSYANTEHSSQYRTERWD